VGEFNGAHSAEISGDCPSRFARVKDAFSTNFSSRGDVGASVAVARHGKVLVDLWDGHQDVGRTTQPCDFRTPR
jgi:hypothetical protein